MASCIQQTLDGSKIFEHTPRGTWSAEAKRMTSVKPQHSEKDVPLFSDGNKYWVAHIVCRSEATRMKLNLKNLRVTASDIQKLYLLI